LFLSPTPELVVTAEREREAVEEEEEKSGERFEVDLVFFFSAFINDYCC